MDVNKLIEQIRAGNLELLRYLWCDNSNVVRSKSLYLPAFMAYYSDSDDASLLAALEDIVSITAAMQSVPATQDAPAPAAGLAPVEDIRLVPAWDAIVPAPESEKIVQVMTTMHEGKPPWIHCPRTFLQRMIARLADHDLALHIGLELEFYLLHPPHEPGGPPAPVDETVYAQNLAAQASQEIISEIVQTLWQQGIPVEQYIPEGGPGQQEITLEHCGPLTLADRLVHARQTIHALAIEHGLIASFLPKIFEDAAGSGLHTHMSLWRDGRNSTADSTQPWGLSQTNNAYLAGILAHLPALMAVTTPTKNSFRRIQPHAWSGAYQAWGIANKEAALRVINDPLSGVPTNIELKTMDGAANPYLALGCMIAAGLDGIENKMRLPDPVEIDPGDYTAAERKKLSLRPLPTTGESALTHFATDSALQQAMGPAMAAVFTAVRRAELQSLEDLAFEAERSLLLQRY